MSMRLILCIIISLFALLTQVVFGAQQTKPQTLEEIAGREKPPVQIPMLDLGLPIPIQYDDLDQFTLILGLSDAQQQEMKRLYKDYLSKFQAASKKYAPDLQKRSIELGSKPIYDLSAFDEYQRSIELCDEYADVCASASADFINKLSPLLSNIQSGSLDRVRNLTIRIQNARCHMFDSGASFDIERVLLRMIMLGPNATDLFHAVDNELLEYEVRATKLSREHVQCYRKSQIEGGKLQAQAQLLITSQPDFESGNIPVDVREAAASLSRRRNELTNADLDVLEEWHRLNNDTSIRFASALPSPWGNDIRSAFLQTAFPNIYPDPFNPYDAVQVILNATDLTSDLRTAILNQLAEYQSEEKAISEQMERVHLPVWFAVARHKVHPSSSEYSEYMKQMNKLQDNRKSIASHVLDSILALIPESHASVFSAAVNLWKDRAKQHVANDRMILYMP
ncbi:MAG TPA: hypothetical protein VG711_11320 [Phycisphaerales bacterium]|nr:hypothetical protein [Phycisphaerales bacterium]